MEENAKRIAAWRASKEAEWEVEGSKLRTKHPTREVFEEWLTKQTQKGRTQANAKARGDSAPGAAGGAAARRPSPDEPKIVEPPGDKPAAPAPGEDGKLVGPGAASAMQMAARAITELLAKGKAQYQAKEYAKCIESHENVIKFLPQVLGNKAAEASGEALMARDMLIQCAVAQNRLQDAISGCYRQAKLRRKVLGFDNPSTLSTYEYLTNLLQQTNQHKNAAPIMEELFEASMRNAQLGPRHLRTIGQCLNITAICNRLQNYDRSIELGRANLTIAREVCGQDNEMAIKVAINLISATISKYGNQGDQEKLEEVQKLGLEFQEIAANALGEDHDLTQMLDSNLERVENMIGTFGETNTLDDDALQNIWKVEKKEGIAAYTEQIATPIREALGIPDTTEDEVIAGAAVAVAVLLLAVLIYYLLGWGGAGATTATAASMEDLYDDASDLEDLAVEDVGLDGDFEEPDLDEEL